MLMHEAVTRGDDVGQRLVGLQFDERFAFGDARTDLDMNRRDRALRHLKTHLRHDHGGVHGLSSH